MSRFEFTRDLASILGAGMAGENVQIYVSSNSGNNGHFTAQRVPSALALGQRLLNAASSAGRMTPSALGLARIHAGRGLLPVAHSDARDGSKRDAAEVPEVVVFRK